MENVFENFARSLTYTIQWHQSADLNKVQNQNMHVTY